MTLSKAKTSEYLEEVLENSSIEQVVTLLANFMSASELEAFLVFVKEEYGIE